MTPDENEIAVRTNVADDPMAVGRRIAAALLDFHAGRAAGNCRPLRPSRFPRTPIRRRAAA